MTDTTLNKEEKFFFTQNIFDDGHKPAATYNEKDAAEFRRQGVAEGRDQAAKEHAESTANRQEKTLATIRNQLEALLSAEKSRQNYYEQETLSLLLLSLKKIFPALEQKIGMDELKNFIGETLKNQDGHPHMTVSVPGEIVNEIKVYIDNLRLSGSEVQCIVKADESLTGTAATVAWVDGGALRNPEKLATEIEAAIQDILAGGAPKGHDKNPDGNGEPV